MQKLLIAAVFVAAIAGGAIAGPSKSNIDHSLFDSVDDYVDALFDRYDRDGNNSITREEIKAYYGE